MDEKKIAAMREGGKIMGQVMQALRRHVRAGMTGREIDAWVRSEIVKRGAGVAYDMLDDNFSGAICISVNDGLVHGVPDDYELAVGDKASFDLDIFYKGYFTDSAFTMIVGEEADETAKYGEWWPGAGRGGDQVGAPAVRRMLSVTESAMWEGVEKVKAGVHLGDVGNAVERVLRKGKLGVIENYIGHGIGKTMHEDPDVPNYGKKGTGYILKAGDTICIEPMSSLGKPKNYTAEDGWTVKMKDGSWGCHFEHTILVLEDGHEVLTLWPN